MTKQAKPTITTAKEATALVQSLRNRAKERNQDLRTLALNKALHLLAESMGYDNWQQLHAALIRQEFIDTLCDTYGYDEANANAAWKTLSTSQIRKAEEASELVEYINRNYAQVPMPKTQKESKAEQLNKAVKEDLLEDCKSYCNGEDIDETGVYASAISGTEVFPISGTEVCLNMGSETNIYLLVDSQYRVLSGRIETDGLDGNSVIQFQKDELSYLEDFLHIEIEMAINK